MVNSAVIEDFLLKGTPYMKLLLLGISVLVAVGSVAQTESVLYRFKGGKQGAFPQAGLVADADGNLYGTTTAGGAGTGCQTGCGTVFTLTKEGSSWGKRVLHSFSNDGQDGTFPMGKLISDASGNFYGTTALGGNGPCGAAGEPSGCGTVFKLSRTQYGWKTTILYAFQGATDGAHPQAELIFDPSGNLYGTTGKGGNPNPLCSASAGCGTVFELSPSPAGVWNQTVLYVFQGGRDGNFPFAGLTLDSSGNLYGTTELGGNTECEGFGCGTAFELSPTKGGWKKSTIYTFRQKNALFPVGTLILDRSGNLYGSSVYGGGRNKNCLLGCGTVFQLSPAAGHGAWKQTVLHVFHATSDGLIPFAGLVFDRRGNLFGTTSEAGSGFGAVFKLTHSNGQWTEHILHYFGGGSDGSSPNAALTYHAGSLYGTTEFGGGTGCSGQGCGVVFEVVP